MEKRSCIEDFSDDIFFEIFGYFHALEIFTGFTLLNKRISSILEKIPFRIIILPKNYHQEINFLSSHLSFHAHQVISLVICDTIRNYPFVINLLFNRHNFINLESCIFISINQLTKLEKVIERIKNMNRLVSFKIYQPYDKLINENYKYNLTRTMFMHKSSALRTIVLHYPYDYSDILSYNSITSNLKSVKLNISGSSSTVSVYSILSILRFCSTVRHLTTKLTQQDINVPILSMNDNNLPILPQMISFHLTILAVCDGRSISSILRCMPKLLYFYFHLEIQKSSWPLPHELLNGYIWKEALERYVPCLSQFEFHMLIMKRYPKLDLDFVVNSFEYFVTKYTNWHMVIDGWKYHRREEYVLLRTLNYHKYNSNVHSKFPFIDPESFETRSTTTTDDHYIFYSNIIDLKLYLIMSELTINWSPPLFQNITNLTIRMPKIQSGLWNNLWNMISFYQTNDNQNIDYLKCFINLSNVIRLEFHRNFDISEWKSIQFILQACTNITDLIISHRLLFSSKLIDDPSLISIFKKIKKIELRTEQIYFPANFASKFVQRFPSIINIQLQVLSFDDCVSIIDTFLIQLENLSFIEIYYNQDTLLDDPFSRDYIIEKRRQAFPNNEKMVIVKNNGQAIKILLS